MSQHPAIPMSHDDRTSSVVVPFDAKWNEHILDGRISAVIRKRYPTSKPVDTLYFYVNAPLSTIIGRAPVKSLRRIDSQAVLALSERLLLSPSEVKQYVGESKSVGLYELDSVELAKRPLSLVTLRQHFVFHPPQGFLFLRRQWLEILARLGDFTPAAQRNHKVKP